MAIIKHTTTNSNSTSPDATASTVRELAGSFGPQLLSQMLAKEPGLVERRPANLWQHFLGLRGVLGGDDALARHIVSRMPDIVKHSHETVATRIAEQSAVFQVSEREFVRLAVKAPALLKLSTSRVAARVQSLQRLTGMSPRQVFQAYLKWPVMATTTPQLLGRRFHAVQQLLQASQADMQRICTVAANLLIRDTARLSDNLSTYADCLQLPLEEVVAIARRQPGLFSWNPDTVVNRITVICQTLRLPAAQRVQLLQANSALLVAVADIPQRVDHLKKLLEVQEPELLPLLHSSLTVLRLPPQLMDSKLACASSLALLNADWTSELQAMQPQHKLRVLVAGSAQCWRLVYLVHSGQQGCSTVKAALHASSANFERLYPDYKGWLHRYNSAVSGKGIPLVPSVDAASGLSDAPPGSDATPAAVYTPVLLGSRTQFGTKTSRAQGDQHAERDRGADAGAAASSAASSSRATDASAVLPPTPAAILAAWWGIGIADAEQLLAGLGRQLRWHQWQERFAALQELQAVLHEPPAAAASSISTSTSSSRRRHMRLARSSSESSSSSDAGGTLGSPLLPVAAAASAAVVQPWGTSGDSSAQQQQQEQGQQVVVQQLEGLRLLPEARQALQQALASGHAAAVAFVSVACHLAPFNQQLQQQLPPKPPDWAVQFALQHPSVISRVAFVADCKRLAAMAADSEHLRAGLQQMGPASLAKCLRAPSAWVLQVQFLVQTQQPAPWAFSLAELTQARLGGRQGAGRRAAFEAAYPQYREWQAEL